VDLNRGSNSLNSISGGLILSNKQNQNKKTNKIFKKSDPKNISSKNEKFQVTKT